MHYGKKMNIMQANPKIGSMDAVLDKLYGKVGSPEREEFRKEAYSYCVGQIISDARKQEKMTQSELAEKVGTNKTYISRIEKGIIEPGVGLFFRIIDALGLKIESLSCEQKELSQIASVKIVFQYE